VLGRLIDFCLLSFPFLSLTRGVWWWWSTVLRWSAGLGGMGNDRDACCLMAVYPLKTFM